MFQVKTSLKQVVNIHIWQIKRESLADSVKFKFNSLLVQGARRGSKIITVNKRKFKLKSGFRYFLCVHLKGSEEKSG
ncbi:hypothetical protein RN001_001255 [Aquatica leii]|uniref:Uncharacterized protein n=1 Tax=Aquatica leii TaxID=1421715 RepID=A0AAN7SL45_9COLE|nr:hypothetical protein RN001_001255 [Aquatica leii]